MQELEHGRTILKRIVIVSVIAVVAAIVFSKTLLLIYFSNQQTSVGYILNGFIFVLFFFGMSRIIRILKDYSREEEALNQFQRNMSADPKHLLDGIDSNSVITARVKKMHGMYSKRHSIDHQAMAATLLAAESTRTGLVRFLHNILILCGVLGTIVSLSIALLGAGDMLGDTSSTEGMGLVIHGMSTALSTTMSAIICYLILAYFLSALQNLQTRFLGHIEEITSTYLMHIYQTSEDSISQHAVDMVSQAHQLLQTINEKISLLNFSTMQEGLQQERMHANQQHKEAIEQAQLQHEESKRQLAELSSILKDGFRLGA